MAVSNDYSKPESADEFEAMCHQLYRHMWGDPSCVRMGRAGQKQSGVDILGAHKGKRIGIQCKHYNKKPFTISAIVNDVKKAEEARLEIDFLLFATTAGSAPELIRAVRTLSEKRVSAGSFGISVDFWGDICGHLKAYPHIGRAFIRDFPGAIAMETLDASLQSLYEIRQSHAASGEQHTQLLSLVQEKFAALNERLATPKAHGDEADPAVAARLDLVRDNLRERKTKDASRILSELGDPEKFKDAFSKFRWYTNWASLELEEGRSKSAAEGYLRAFEYAKEDERAIANRAHAYLLLGNPDAALQACNDGLSMLGDNAQLWAIKLHALQVLGNGDVEDQIPTQIRESQELLFSRAKLASNAGNHEQALSIYERILEVDEKCFQAKRCFLAEALEWGAADATCALSGHIDEKKRRAILNALQHLEPLEQTLASVQSDVTCEELVFNSTNALCLLGDEDRAQGISKIFLPKFPLAEPLLRVRLLGMAREKSFADIKTLTAGLSEDLPLPILALLIEFSASSGDTQEFERIFRCAAEKESNRSRLRDLEIFRFQAQWNSGQSDSAMQGLQLHLAENEDHIMARVLLSEFLARSNKRDEATAQAESCIAAVEAAGSSFEKMQVADMLFRLEDYESAAKVYGALVTHPGDDPLTRSFLISLVKTDQRAKAHSVLEQLPPSSRNAHSIRRIECNLASRMSNWSRLKELLAVELRDAPGSADLAVAYAGTLYRNGDYEEWRAYLISNPVFDEASAENEFEFAKHQLNAGYPLLAVTRLYALYRSAPSSTKIAGFYLSQLLLSQLGDALEPPLEVELGSAVKIRTDAGERWVLIDHAHFSDSWPELISADSAWGTALLGKSIGDKVSIDIGFTPKEAEVIEIRSALVFAADKAHERLAASASQDGPLWSFNAFKSDGELDLETISASARERRQFVEKAFESYRDHRLPLSVLAKLVGTDVATLVWDWPYLTYDFFVANGSHEERAAAVHLIKETRQRYVIDLVSIAELTKLELFDPIVSMTGPLLVPQSIRDELVAAIHILKAQNPAATLGESEGRLAFFEVDSSERSRRTSFLDSVLSNLDKCEVCPTVGPSEIDEELRRLGTLLEAHAADSIYLCGERNAVLITEDGGLRQILSMRGGSTIWLQPLTLVALERGVISQEDYASAVFSKVFRRHAFTSIRRDDLIYFATQNTNVVSNKALVLLDTLRPSTIDLRSAVEVSFSFLHFAAGNLPSEVVAGYSQRLYEVLSSSRPEISKMLRSALAEILKKFYGRNGRRLKARARRAFGILLAR